MNIRRRRPRSRAVLVLVSLAVVMTLFVISHQQLASRYVFLKGQKPVDIHLRDGDKLLTYEIVAHRGAYKAAKTELLAGKWKLSDDFESDYHGSFELRDPLKGRAALFSGDYLIDISERPDSSVLAVNGVPAEGPIKPPAEIEVTLKVVIVRKLNSIERAWYELSDRWH